MRLKLWWAWSLALAGWLLAFLPAGRALEIRSSLKEAGASSVLYTAQAEGAESLSLTLEPTWGLMLRQATDGQGKDLSPRRLPYGDVFVLSPEAGGVFRLKLVFSANTVGALEVRMGDISAIFPGGVKAPLTSLARMLLIEDPASPVSSVVKTMVTEQNALGAQAVDQVKSPALAAAPGDLSGSPSLEAVPLTPALTPLAAAGPVKNFRFLPQARSKVPPKGLATLLPLLFSQRQGSKSFTGMELTLNFDPGKAKLVKPAGQETYCRPNLAFYALDKEEEVGEGKLKLSMRFLPGAARIYDTAYQLCGFTMEALGSDPAEVRVTEVAMDGLALPETEWESGLGGFGVALAAVAPPPGADAAPREKLRPETDLIKADVVLSFNTTQLELGLGDVQEIAVKIEKFPVTSKVAGASVKVNFDQRYIRVVDKGGAETNAVTLNPVFEWTPTNKVDNFAGTVDVDLAVIANEVAAPVELFRFYIKGAAPQPVVTFRIDPTNVILPGLFSSNTVAVMPLNITVKPEKGKSRVAGAQGFRISGTKTVSFGTTHFQVEPERRKVTGPLQINAFNDKNFDRLEGYVNAKVGTEVVLLNGKALARGRSEPLLGGGFPNGGFSVTGGDYDIRVENEIKSGVTTQIPIIVWRDPDAMKVEFKTLEITYDAVPASANAGVAFGTIGASLKQTTNLQFSGGVGGKVALDGEVSENPGTPAIRRFNLTTQPAVFKFGDINAGVRGGNYTTFSRQGEGVEFSLRPGGKLKDKFTLDGVFMQGKSESVPPRPIQGIGAGPFSFAPNEPIVPGSVVVTLNNELLPGGEYEVDYGRGQLRLLSRQLTQGDQMVVSYERSTFLFFTGGLAGFRATYKPSAKFNLGYSRLSSEASKSSAETRLFQTETNIGICRTQDNAAPCGDNLENGQFKITRPLLDDRTPSDINIRFVPNQLSSAEIDNLLAQGTVTSAEAALLREPGQGIKLNFGQGSDVYFDHSVLKYRGVLTIQQGSLAERVGFKGVINVSYPYFNPTYVQRLRQVIEGYRRDKDYKYTLPSNTYIGSEQIFLNSGAPAEALGLGGRDDYEIKQSGSEIYAEFANNLNFPEGGKIVLEFDVVPPDQSKASSFDKIVEGVDFSFKPTKRLSLSGEYARSTGDLGSVSANFIDTYEQFDTKCEYLRCKLSAKPTTASTPTVQLVLPNGETTPITQFFQDVAAGTITLIREENINPYGAVNVLRYALPIRDVLNFRLDESFCNTRIVDGEPYNYRCKLPYGNLANIDGFKIREGEGAAVHDVNIYRLFPETGIIYVSRTVGQPLFVDFQYVPTDIALRVTYQTEAVGAKAGEIVTGGVYNMNVDYQGNKFRYTGTMVKKDKTFIEFANNPKGVAANSTNQENHSLSLTPIRDLNLNLNMTKSSAEPIAGNGSSNQNLKTDLNYKRGRLKRLYLGYENNETATTLGNGGLVSALQSSQRPRTVLGIELGLLKNDKLRLTYDAMREDFQNRLDPARNRSTNNSSLKASLALGSRGAIGYRTARDSEGNGWGYDFRYALAKSGRVTFESGYDKVKNTVHSLNKLSVLPQKSLRFDISLDRNLNRSLQGLAARRDAYVVDINKTKWGPFLNPRLSIRREDNPLEQGGQRTETRNFDTSFTLLKTIQVTPRYTETNTQASTQDNEKKNTSLTFTYTPKAKFLRDRRLTMGYSLNSTKSANIPKTTATAPGAAAVVTGERSGTFNFRVDPMKKLSTDFAYTFGGATDTMRLSWTYTHNTKLSVTGAFNFTETNTTQQIVGGALSALKTSSRNHNVTLKYRLTELTALDVIYDFRGNQGSTPGSSYNGYSLTATLTANFLGL